jgi:hypothetical protein
VRIFSCQISGGYHFCAGGGSGYGDYYNDIFIVIENGNQFFRKQKNSVPRLLFHILYHQKRKL